MTGALVSWDEFARRAPELAEAGRALLCPNGKVAIGFLATVSARGDPGLAPVCPIFCDGHVHLSVAAASPKRRHLDADGRYVLHAFLGPSDREFQIAGLAERVDDSVTRQRVQAAIPFAAYGVGDPIYRLAIRRCLFAYWENAGQPDTRVVRLRYRAERHG